MKSRIGDMKWRNKIPENYYRMENPQVLIEKLFVYRVGLSKYKLVELTGPVY